MDDADSGCQNHRPNTQNFDIVRLILEPNGDDSQYTAIYQLDYNVPASVIKL